jgi:hypothetical protein
VDDGIGGVSREAETLDVWNVLWSMKMRYKYSISQITNSVLTKVHRSSTRVLLSRIALGDMFPLSIVLVA